MALPLYSLSTAFVENAQTLLPHSLEILEHTGISTGLSRITPANAWNTPHNSPRCSRPGDHPRVRGEGLRYHVQDHRRRGSPPRSRGRRSVQTFRILGDGITPAFAGKAISMMIRKYEDGDHPRVRGEGSSLSISRTASRGSPPRSRGRLVLYFGDVPYQGITPAFAGKAVFRRPTGFGARDHPRVRGEGTWVTSSGITPEGSPPRSRGRL